jgi:hypothetical protein
MGRRRIVEPERKLACPTSSAADSDDLAQGSRDEDTASPPLQAGAGYAQSNGLVVSLDGRKLYVNESEAGRILVPDGPRIDRNGNLFVGLYDGGGFAVLAPDGKLLQKVGVPGAHHANLALCRTESPSPSRRWAMPRPGRS